MTAEPRVTLVHERFTEYAGSEAVVEQLAREFPDAPILAPVARRGVMPPDLDGRVRSTWLSTLLAGGTYAHLLPVLPAAVRHLRLPPSDVVVASHHAFATQVALATATPVVAYVHSPARWAWEPSLREGEAGRGLGAAGLAAFSAAFRPHDVKAAQRVHTLVANSRAVAQRIADWWGRDATVVHPPVDTEYFTPADVPREDFYLYAGRLVPYKRPDIAVRAAAAADVPLVVAGDGRARPDVERFAGPRTRFAGRVSDQELRDLFRRCRALLMPGVEDFGIVPVEAMACGAPVIAVDAGGARDTVVPGLSGELVPQAPLADDRVAAWAEKLRAFDPRAHAAAGIRDHAEHFSRARFRQAMGEVVRSTVASPARAGWDAAW